MKNCLKKLIGIISSFIETEYWYRFRKTKAYGRNVSLLNDSWGGSSTLIKWQILKIEHTYHNIRKHSPRTLCYIDSSTFLDKSNENDKKLIIKYIQDEALTDKVFHWLDGHFYYTFENKWAIHKSDGKDSFKVEFDSWDDMESWADENIANEEYSFTDIVIKNAISIDIDPSDLYKFSDKVRNNLRGKRMTLHNLAKYRKLLKKLDSLDFPYDEPWDSKIDDIYDNFKDDSYLRRKALNDLSEEFKSYRMSILNEIAQFWNEKCDQMWD